jgi:hypothetical protein
MIQAPELPRLPFFLFSKHNHLAATFNQTRNLIFDFNPSFNQAWHQAIFLHINTLLCLKINQYRTGLFVSYSVKTQLHEKCLGKSLICY